MGHRSTGTDGKWAYNNLQAEIDFGFRATHVAALAGKAVTERYYSKKPGKSYYMGCSTGGRQGLIEAQRFPWDFDGLIVGAPVISMTDLLMDSLWKHVVATDEMGKSILSKDDLRLVHSAVVGRCDMDDGVKDGVVGDPQGCRFDPSRLLCQDGGDTGCLSERKVEVLRKLYSGPTTSQGDPVAIGGTAMGSELGLEALSSDGLLDAVTEFFRYMAFAPDPGPIWQAKNFDFDRDYKRFGMMEALYGAANPDLRRLKAAGGKIILYQGWNDGAFAMQTLDYYHSVATAMGGRAVTDEFMRLFMVPGMGHCTGGDGAFAFDYLSYLEAWVEREEAPDVIIGAHVTESDLANLHFPLDKTKVQFTRPVYPFPLRARYKGRGATTDAENFYPVGR